MMKSLHRIVLSAVLTLSGLGNVLAGETFIPITPPGGTDTSQAILPPPGAYGAVIAIPYTQSNQLYDYKGNPAPSFANLQIDAPLGAAAFLYVYQNEILGGRLATSVVLSGQQMCAKIGNNPRNCGGSGLGDVYSDLFMWSKNLGLAGVTPGKMPLPYGLNFSFGTALKAPTGKYDLQTPVNTGGNIWVVVPNFALTYVTGPNMSFGDATEISARFFFGFPMKNTATNYESGNVLNIDWAVTQRFGPLAVGLSGYYYTQLTGDLLNGVEPVGPRYAPGGNKSTFAALGPVLEYDMPDKGMVFKLKYLAEPYYIRNSVNQQSLIASLFFKL